MMKLFTRFAAVLALATALLFAPTVAKAQYNPATIGNSTLTLYNGQSITLGLQGYDPSGKNPFTLENPFYCMSAQFLTWNGVPNQNILWYSHTGNTITLTAHDVGTTVVSAQYQVSDCWNNQTDLNATLTVTVVPAPTGQAIYGDSQLYFVPGATTPFN